MEKKKEKRGIVYYVTVFGTVIVLNIPIVGDILRYLLLKFFTKIGEKVVKEMDK